MPLFLMLDIQSLLSESEDTDFLVITVKFLGQLRGSLSPLGGQDGQNLLGRHFVYTLKSQDMHCNTGCNKYMRMFTVCPGSSDLFYIVTYYIKWVTTSWTYSISVFNTIQ